MWQQLEENSHSTLKSATNSTVWTVGAIHQKYLNTGKKTWFKVQEIFETRSVDKKFRANLECKI